MTRPRTGAAAFADAVPAGRRQEILVGCIRVLARRGFARTRMSDIAEEIGVTAPLLLHYFPSKNELITEALVASDEAYLVEFSEALAAGEPPERLVVRYVEDSVWPALRGRAWWSEASAVWMNAWITALHDPSIARVRAAEDRRWRAALAEVVAKGRAEGVFAADVEPDVFVPTLFAMLDGFMVQLVLDDPVVTPRLALEQSLRFVERELGFDPHAFSTRPRASP